MVLLRERGEAFSNAPLIAFYNTNEPDHYLCTSQNRTLINADGTLISADSGAYLRHIYAYLRPIFVANQKVQT
jgi:hypothetical protein